MSWMSSAIFVDSGDFPDEESGTGLLSVMMGPNAFVSKRLEDYTVRLGTQALPLPRAGDQRKMPRKKTAASKHDESNPLWTERLRYFEARQEQIVQTIREF